MAVAILALGATLANAQGSMNLAWNTCRTLTNNNTAATNDQTTFTNSVCDNPAQQFLTKRIVCSMKNSSTLPGWGGTTIEVNFYVGAGGNPLPDFWDFSPTGCRNGSVAGPTTSVNATACANPYRPGGINNDPQGETESSNVAFHHGPGVITYQADHVRNTTQINLSPPSSPGGWLVNNLALDGLSNDTCAGCDATVCVELAFVQYFSLFESRTITATELRNFITINGGNGPSCSTAVPVRATTWGQVKALYR